MNTYGSALEVSTIFGACGTARETFLTERVLPGVESSAPFTRRYIELALNVTGNRYLDEIRLVLTELAANIVLHTRSEAPGGLIIVDAANAGLGGGAVSERFLGEVVLPGVAQSVAVARRCVGEMLAAAGHRDVENARLIVSELTTNTLLHTASGLQGGVVTVEVIAVDAEIVRVEVTDDGADTIPRVRVSGGEDCHGRGLWLVEQVSLKWGVRLLGAGQRAVWAETFTGQTVPGCAGEGVVAGSRAESGR